MSETIRATCFLSGRVQGVGMRFAVHELARRSLGLTGFVQNTVDGRVHLVVEGERDAIDRFLEQLTISAPGALRSIDRFDSAASGEFSNFTIVR